MNAKTLIPILLIALTVRSAAFGDDVTRAGDELVTTLQLELKNLAGEEADNQQNALKQYIRQVQLAMVQENGRSLEQYLDNFGNYEPSEACESRIEALKKSVREEIVDNTNAVATELRGILDEASETVRRATEAEELDKLLVRLSSNRLKGMSENKNYDSNDATIRGLMSEVSNARQFVTSWQDYLQASNSGNSGSAIQSLNNLASRESTLIPRSQIIARIEFETTGIEEISKITEAIDSLDGMKGALAKLSSKLGSSRSSSSDNAELRDAVQSLTRLEKTYREFLAGLPVNMEILYRPADAFDPAGKPDFVRLRADLLLLVLPRCLDLPDGFQATNDETVDHFLKRALDDATQRGDTGAARRIKDTSLLLVRANTLNEEDLEALRDYSAGQSQFAAGQYVLAVMSFQKALATGSDLIPSVSTGKLLATIEKEHPEEFANGMMEFLTPQPTPEYDYSRMPWRSYRSPHMMRGYNDDPRFQRGTSVVLPVPAKDPAPAGEDKVKAVPSGGH